MFASENFEVNHLKLFSCLVYLHVTKDKRSKLDPSGKKGILVGYTDQLKAYIIYIPGFCKIELSRDVTFDEYVAFNKSRKTNVDEEEHETTRVVEISKPLVKDE